MIRDDSRDVSPSTPRCCGRPVDRRDFLRILGAGAVLAAGPGSFPLLAGPRMVVR